MYGDVAISTKEIIQQTLQIKSTTKQPASPRPSTRLSSTICPVSSQHPVSEIASLRAPDLYGSATHPHSFSSCKPRDMSLHGLGVIGAQVGASIKSTDEKLATTPMMHSPSVSIQSTPSMNEPRKKDFDPHDGAKPYSPFYRHGSPTISYEQLTFETKDAADREYSGLRDIENAEPYFAPRNDSPRRSKLWEAEKKPRTWLQSLTSRQRMALKAVLAVVTVGTMIAIALGITAAVGGASWRASTKQAVQGG